MLTNTRAKLAAAIIIASLATPALALKYASVQHHLAPDPSIPASIGRSARGPFIEGTPASVASRSYPLSRSIYIAFDPDAMTAPLCQFLQYTLTDDAQHALSQDPQQFLPLPARDLESSRKGLRVITHGHCRQPQ